MIPPKTKKIKSIFAFFCEFMHFLNSYAKYTPIYESSLFVSTNKMYKNVHNITNIHRKYARNMQEELYYIKMFVQIAKGKNNKAAKIIFKQQTEENK